MFQPHVFNGLVCFKMKGKMQMHIERALHSGNQLRSEMHMQRAAFLNTQKSLQYGAPSDDEDSDLERPRKRKRLIKTSASKVKTSASKVKTSASKLQSKIESDIESDIESAGEYESDDTACKDCGNTDLTEENACRICCKPRKVRIDLTNHQEK